MQPENLDDFIRKRLQRFRPAKPTDDALWDSIANALDNQRRPWYGRHNTIPAAMFLAFTMVLSYTGNMEVRDSQMASSHYSKPGMPATEQGIRSSELAFRNPQDAATSATDLNPNQNSAVNNLQTVESRKQLAEQSSNGSAQKSPGKGRKRGNGRKSASHTPSITFASQSAELNTQYGIRNTIYAANNMQDAGRNTQDVIRRSQNEILRLENPAATIARPEKDLIAGLPYRIKDEKRNSPEGKLTDDHAKGWSDWHNINYQSWNNAATTGIADGYNFTWHDRMAYVQDGPEGEYQDQFALETQVPGSKLGAGVYYGRYLRPYSFISNISANLSYPLLKIGGGELRTGLSGVLMQKQLFGTYLVYQDQYTPTGTFVQTSQEKFFSTNQQAVAVNAGLFYSNNRLMAGFSADNLNTPNFSFTDDGEHLGREYSVALGYKMNLSKNLQVMPWAEMRTTELTTTLSGTVMAVYKNKYMLGLSQQNIDASTLTGEMSLYAGVEIKKCLRLFASYGQNMELARYGIPQRIFHAGLRIHLPN